jgi:hypothetical protein
LAIAAKAYRISRKGKESPVINGLSGAQGDRTYLATKEHLGLEWMGTYGRLRAASLCRI